LNLPALSFLLFFLTANVIDARRTPKASLRSTNPPVARSEPGGINADQVLARLRLPAVDGRYI
jgi:hypothetical protein